MPRRSKNKKKQWQETRGGGWMATAEVARDADGRRERGWKIRSWQWGDDSEDPFGYDQWWAAGQHKSQLWPWHDGNWYPYGIYPEWDYSRKMWYPDSSEDWDYDDQEQNTSSGGWEGWGWHGAMGGGAGKLSKRKLSKRNTKKKTKKKSNRKLSKRKSNKKYSIN